MTEQEKIQILQQMNNCSTCVDIENTTVTQTTDFSIDYLLNHLPGIDYAVQRMLNYMFSNGVTTGQGKREDDHLDEWLYEGINKQDSTNYSVLRAVLRDAIVRGECGLRLYDNGLYQVPQGYYGILYQLVDGVQEVVAYFISAKGAKVTSELDTSTWDTFASYLDIQNWFETNGLILLDATEFVNIRNDVSTLHGYSPFTRDKERINLLMGVYDRLNYDIRYDGPGRLLLKTKDMPDTENERSTEEIINDAPFAQEDRYKEAILEANSIASQIKNSSSDMVGVISGAFDDKVIHLPRVTQATEFLEWISVDTVIMAQLIGMSPALLEVGAVHGNVSMEKIIDNSMENTIIPIRESYAIQFSPLLAKAVGVQKVYFDKYALKQLEDENEIRARVANIIKSLCVANKNTPNASVEKLIDEFSMVLETSVYDDDGQIRGL